MGNGSSDINVEVGGSAGKFNTMIDGVKGKLSEVGDVSERRAERGLGRAAHAMITSGGAADSLAGSLEVLSRTFNVGLGAGIAVAVGVGIFEKIQGEIKKSEDAANAFASAMGGIKGGAEGVNNSIGEINAALKKAGEAEKELVEAQGGFITGGKVILAALGFEAPLMNQIKDTQEKINELHTREKSLTDSKIGKENQKLELLTLELNGELEMAEIKKLQQKYSEEIQGAQNNHLDALADVLKVEEAISIAILKQKTLKEDLEKKEKKTSAEKKANDDFLSKSRKIDNEQALQLLRGGPDEEHRALQLKLKQAHQETKLTDDGTIERKQAQLNELTAGTNLNEFEKKAKEEDAKDKLNTAQDRLSKLRASDPTVDDLQRHGGGGNIGSGPTASMLEKAKEQVDWLKKIYDSLSGNNSGLTMLSI